MEYFQFFKSVFTFITSNNLLAPAVLAFSVFFSYRGIVKVITNNRQNIKDGSTISYIMDRNCDTEFTNALGEILKIDRDDNQDIKKYAKKEHRSTESATKIRYIANHYEYLSVGVFNDIYNEDMLKKSSKGTTIKVHQALENYISEIRKERQSNTIYENFDRLVDKWEKEI